MISFLTSQETLEKQVGRSLNERCVLFHRQFSLMKISTWKLAQIYKQHGIKKKVIKHTKLRTPRQETRMKQQVTVIAVELQELIDQRYTIIYLDEVMFTTRTVLSREYSNKNQNIQIDYKDINTDTTAVIAAISFETGVDLCISHKKSVNIPKYLDYI